jgi:hypothetical protein
MMYLQSGWSLAMQLAPAAPFVRAHSESHMDLRRYNLPGAYELDLCSVAAFNDAATVLACGKDSHQYDLSLV